VLLIAEVAALLRISESTVRRRIKDGTIPVTKVGRAVRISEAVIAALISANA
jgi:excisionase family DNA binding protein